MSFTKKLSIEVLDSLSKTGLAYKFRRDHDTQLKSIEIKLKENILE